MVFAPSQRLALGALVMTACYLGSVSAQQPYARGSLAPVPGPFADTGNDNEYYNTPQQRFAKHRQQRVEGGDSYLERGAYVPSRGDRLPRFQNMYDQDEDAASLLAAAPTQGEVVEEGGELDEEYDEQSSEFDEGDAGPAPASAPAPADVTRPKIEGQKKPLEKGFQDPTYKAGVSGTVDQRPGRADPCGPDGCKGKKDPSKATTEDAIDAVQEAIEAKVAEGEEEKKWVSSAQEMTHQYLEKIGKVNGHIETIKSEVRGLLLKKKQLQNKALQEQLASKLELAQGDLENLDGVLHNVKAKESEFSQNKSKIQKSINEIKAQMAALKGEPAPVEEKTAPDAAEEPSAKSALLELQEAKELNLRKIEELYRASEN